MYAEHVPTIAAAMRNDADVFARGCTFVVLTIQQMIVTVPEAVADVDANGLQSRFLFGHKRDAFAYIQEHKAELLRDVLACGDDTASAIRVLMHIPGLGIVKSAFVLQLMGFDIACLDTRNIQREGRNPNAYRSMKKSRVFWTKRVAAYVADTGGRAREYWDLWCQDVATAYKRTADAISRIHLDCIVPAGMIVDPICVPCAGTPDVLTEIPW